jgi:hypothetical protein
MLFSNIMCSGILSVEAQAGQSVVHTHGEQRSTLVQQSRKNPPPAVREDQGNGIYLLVHGQPHDPCPVAGCAGTLRFLHR